MTPAPAASDTLTALTLELAEVQWFGAPEREPAPSHRPFAPIDALLALGTLATATAYVLLTSGA